MYEEKSRISAKTTIPLCSSALTYSSSNPGKRDIALGFSWTVLIGSTVALRCVLLVSVDWLIKRWLSISLQVKANRPVAFPVRAALSEPAAHAATPLQPTSFEG